MSTPRIDLPMSPLQGFKSLDILKKLEPSPDPVDSKQTTPLEQGDIVISLSQVIKHPENISTFSAHGTVFHGTSNVVHATVSRFYQKVRSHYIDKVFERDDRLGSVVVFRNRQPMIKAQLANIVCESKFSNTPFTYTFNRRLDDVKHEAQRRLIEFFRAFRAYQRIVADTPIRKKSSDNR